MDGGEGRIGRVIQRKRGVGWWLDGGWVVVGWWLGGGWMVVGWWLDGGWVVVGWWLDGGWMSLMVE